MLKNFFKYQSLGNDFILFDCYKKPETYINQALADASFPVSVCKLCDRHFGIGADGVLVLKGNTSSSLPEMLIFNADGSKAEICLNGLRCVALHLHSNYKFPTQFKIKAGEKIVECFILYQKDINERVLIKTDVGIVNYLGEICIKTNQAAFCGHSASIGNPHFIVFQQTSNEWLSKYGASLEAHEAFPNKTNVEFVWADGPLRFKSLVYERGCGITLACSSGAASIAGTLAKLGQVPFDKEFKISMPGGDILCSVDKAGNVSLSAGAKLVFSGIYENE